RAGNEHCFQNGRCVPLGENVRVVCPTTVGRASVAEALEEGLTLAAGGEGSVVFLTGAAGMGKSRLAGELANQAAAKGMLVLTGRTAAIGEDLPFRPVSEALSAAFRHSPPPMPPELDAYGPALRVVLPDWVAGGEGAPPSTLQVLEGVVRLLALIGSRDGLLLVLEDLHRASPETIAVVEYLAENLIGERILCVCTGRELPENKAV